MKKLLVIAVLLVAPIVAFAQTPATSVAVHNGEIDLGGSYQNTEKGNRSGTFNFDMLAPLLKYLDVGPQVKGEYSNGITGVGFGAVGEVNFGHHNIQPYGIVEGVRWTGSFENQVRWQLGAGGGIKAGIERAYVRVGAERVRSYSPFGNLKDSTEFIVGVGFRM